MSALLEMTKQLNQINQVVNQAVAILSLHRIVLQIRSRKNRIYTSGNVQKYFIIIHSI